MMTIFHMVTVPKPAGGVRVFGLKTATPPASRPHGDHRMPGRLGQEQRQRYAQSPRRFRGAW